MTTRLVIDTTIFNNEVHIIKCLLKFSVCDLLLIGKQLEAHKMMNKRIKTEIKMDMNKEMTMLDNQLTVWVKIKTNHSYDVEVIDYQYIHTNRRI